MNMQMVSLGKDPKGESVLGEPATPDQQLSNLQSKATSELGTTTQQDEITVLRQQVAELREELKRIKEVKEKIN